MSDGSTSEKPSLAEKVAYGLGDTACKAVMRSMIRLQISG
jgi:hypothetical protein